MAPIWGQTSTEDASNLKEATLLLDLRTATYFELAAWSERLDLSARGGRSELQHRLEEYYGLPRSEAEPQESGREIQIESADQ